MAFYTIDFRHLLGDDAPVEWGGANQNYVTLISMR